MEGVGAMMQTKRYGRWARPFLGVFLLFAASPALVFGAAEPSRDTAPRRAFGELPYPEALRPQVEFWTNVFGKYSRYQAVIHDTVYLDKVYAVLDFESLYDRYPEAKARRMRSARVKREVKKIRTALRNLHRHSAKGGRLSSREREIRAMFADVDERHKFRKAAARGRLRTQTGVRERFREGFRISGRYLPEIERIFRQEGLPVELTRLPFVESSFNVDAYSKAGAAGVWQFIPSTGRLYLTINHVVDERRDPLLATRAAARLLKDNYAALKTWPLAVTAYNHGRAGMKRAVRRLGTRDITKIIRRYDGRTFGFASRNFYAELLAAIEVERNAETYFGPIQREAPLTYDEVTLPHFVSLYDLATAAALDRDDLLGLNQSFGRLIRRGDLHVPRGHTLRIPAGTKDRFLARYAALAPDVKADRQAAAITTHRVRRGQTLGSIARLYGTNVRALTRINGLRSAHLIRVGQRLQVPTRGAGIWPAKNVRRATVHIVRRGESLGRIARRYKTTVAALTRLNNIRKPSLIRVGQKIRVAGRANEAAPRTYVKHKVRRGQTLGSIARRYGTSVATLKRLNGVRNVRLLQIGQVLRVPRG